MPKPIKYRRRPIEVEAMQWAGDTVELAAFVGTLNWGRADVHDIPWEHEDAEEVVIWNEAAKAWVPAPVGWWIIRGALGECYPCNPNVFAATYEPAVGGDEGVKVYSIKVEHEDGYSLIEKGGDTPEDAQRVAGMWAEQHRFEDVKVGPAMRTR